MGREYTRKELLNIGPVYNLTWGQWVELVEKIEKLEKLEAFARAYRRYISLGVFSLESAKAHMDLEKAYADLGEI